MMTMGKRPVIALIAAVARNGVIGKDNRLLWHLPEDMRHFRETTRGKPVIMGRKTWESLPEKFRPLPGRLNIVVSRDRHYPATGATVADSLASAISAAQDAEEIFIIGGETLYRQAMPLADRLYLTEIDRDFDGDAFFPPLDRQAWQESRRQHPLSTPEMPLDFVEYRLKTVTI